MLKLIKPMLFMLAAIIINIHVVFASEPIDVNQKVTLLLDGAPLENSAMLLDGHIYVSLSTITTAIGADTARQEALNEIYLTFNNNIIVFEINSTKASKNGQPFVMDYPVKIVNDNAFVPLRAFADSLGCSVTLDEANKSATMSTKSSLPPSNNIIIAPDNTITPNKPQNTQKPTMNKVNAIHATSINGVDEIVISGDISVNPNAFWLTEPDRLVIDLPNTQTAITTTPSVAGLAVVSQIRTGQQEGNVLRIVLEASPKSGCTMTYDGGNLKLVITKTGGKIVLPPVVDNTFVTTPETTEKQPTAVPHTLKNITYEKQQQQLKLKKLTPMQTAAIKHNDNYRAYSYTLTLPGNYENDYGSGYIAINDEFLVGATISTSSGFTNIVFDEKRIRSFWISEDANYYYINIKDPKAVYPKIVVIDAGHGGNDPGTNGNGIIEKDVALAIATRLYQKLEKDNSIKAYFIRSDDTNPDKAWRAAFANDVGDIFISIHLNTADQTDVKNPLPNGTETLYKDHPSEVGAALTSKSLATVIQKNVSLNLGSTDRGLKYRDDLLLLNTTTIPSVILETAFLSNPGEALKITQPEYQEMAAQGIYAGIIEAFSLK